MFQHQRRAIQKRWFALTIFVLALIGFGVYAVRNQNESGVWTKTSPDTLEFDGAIWPGSETAFFEIVTPEIKRLVVRSGGGDSNIALQIAEYIHQQQLDLEVRDYCYSSCANYWFTAANKKTVPRSAAVGFHGDPFTTAQYVQTTDQKTLNIVEQFDVLAKPFYKEIGLNPALFPHSLAFTNSNQVNLWAPSPKELKCAGVNNLEMWFPESEADYKLGDFAQAHTIGTSAQDVRKPKPDFCQRIKSGS
jgi:hypothetical protein